MTRAAPTIAAVLAAAALSALPGCASDPTRGYSVGWTFDESIRTVSVPIFENKTFVTGVEEVLTDSIIKQIQSRTPWVVTTANADTTLVGEITDVRRRLLSNSPTSGFIQEQAISVEIAFTWRDNRTGQSLSQATNFAATSTFIPVRPVGQTAGLADGQIGERPEVGQRDAINELAEAVVERMRSRW